MTFFVCVSQTILTHMSVQAISNSASKMTGLLKLFQFLDANQMGRSGCSTVRIKTKAFLL